MTKTLPAHPVRIAPGQSVTFRLGLRCGVQEAPPSPPWRTYCVTFPDPDEAMTFRAEDEALLVLFHVEYHCSSGDRPARVTVWVRTSPENTNDSGL
jgi:hypothetical protein